MDRSELDKLIIEEGDYYEWFNSFKCYIKRNSLGAWCGYVLILNSNPSINYISDTNISDLICHGGITLVDRDNVRLKIGFDCCHFGDLLPKMPMLDSALDGQYRDKEFVINEVNHIVDQLMYIISEKRNSKIDLLI